MEFEAADPTNILARVAGAYVSDALQQLPKAETATEYTVQIELEVPELGLVRFTAKRYRHRHGRAVIYFWNAESAVMVVGAAAG